ncbi:MAG: AAA family ATPase, partial [Polyangia bacterium]|jgi:serine/threonine-protein kinase|nr:AAA family ATPase [Polyangia bacterium]
VRETADLYSLGAMLFEMLTGRPPFDSESVMEVLALHLSTPPPRLREVAPERALPEALEAVLLRTLAKPAEERFQSAGELRRALASIAIEEARRDASCPTCGAYITPNARFCASCGASTSLLSDPCDAAESQRNRRATAETALQVGAPTPPRQSRSSSPLATGERAASGELPSTTLNRRLRVEQTRRFALTGREEELGRLAAFLNGAEGALEILGPIGSGRTRLLAEAKELAARLGVEARQANPDPTLARRPWEPVQRLVSSTLGLGPRPGQHAIRASLAQAGLPPEDLLGLSELFELRDPDACLEHAVRLRETKAAAMRAICSRADDARPLLVTVDDADELDPASRSVFLDLAAMADGRRLKVLLVAERSLLPPGQRPPPIEPRPLTRKEISDLWDVLDGRPTDTEADRLRIIAERSEGLPLHVIQAMRLLCEGGSEVDVPLGELVQTRVRRLPTEALRLLQTLSVIGVRAKLERVASLLDQKPDRFRGALQLLAKRDLVSESPEGELLITHPRIGEIVREAIPADARRRQHRALLEELRAAGEPPVALARHALEARLGEEALQLLLAAGAQAELSLDDAGAVVHFKRALQVARWELLLDERDPTCLDLSLRLGEALRYSGDLLGAQMVLGELVQSASGHPATRARALRALALLLQARGDPATALETMQQAVREAFFASDPTLLNQIYMDLGRVLELSGDGERALQELSEGVLMVTNGDGAEAPQAPDSFWRLLGQISELYFRKGELTAALQSAHAALWQAERAGSKVGAARCNFLLGRCYDRLGVIEEAEKHHAMALETFRQLGDRRSAAEVLLSGARYYTTEKEDLLSQAQGLLGQLQWRPDAKHLPS